MPRRLRRVATRQTVPLPTKGSSTVQGTFGASQSQVGCQPVVSDTAGDPDIVPDALFVCAQDRRVLSGDGGFIH